MDILSLKKNDMKPTLIVNNWTRHYFLSLSKNQVYLVDIGKIEIFIGGIIKSFKIIYICRNNHEGAVMKKTTVAR